MDDYQSTQGVSLRDRLRQERIKFIVEQALKSPSARKVKPSYPVNSEILEDWMERPPMDMRSYAFHWEGDEMVEGRK